jgi:hypothetical protein
MAFSFLTKGPTLNVIISEEFVGERLSPVSGDEPKAWRYIFEDDRKVETVVTQWLITQDTD